MTRNMNAREIDRMLSDLNDNLPACLRTLRLREGLTQEQFSELIGMSRTSYNRIEKGRACPDLLTVCVILFTFGISLDFLLGGSLENHVENADCSRNSRY